MQSGHNQVIRWRWDAQITNTRFSKNISNQNIKISLTNDKMCSIYLCRRSNLCSPQCEQLILTCNPSQCESFNWAVYELSVASNLTVCRVNATGIMCVHWSLWPLQSIKVMADSPTWTKGDADSCEVDAASTANRYKVSGPLYSKPLTTDT